ncbi:MAG TPA: flagellar hook capping FlgD N-terminal domain-containing protein [Acidobacteriaceae bacterium]|nr:flagellar hook capping FlgD N-terminal domain-containing protein [Acidobacteriaceae bacterium]
MSLLLGVLDHVKQAVTAPFESKSQTPTAGVNAHATSSNGTTGATGSSTNQATITANDFLTLLVTEIQNQDPTTQTDPMQYITQLVGVNSLEQLVQINQTLTTATGVPSTGSAGSSPSPVTAAAAAKSAFASASAGSANLAHLLPSASHVQLPASADSAVANAFTQASSLPTQAQSPSQVPLSPEVMRALQHSIPGATFTGSSSLPAAIQPGTGGAVR